MTDDLSLSYFILARLEEQEQLVLDGDCCCAEVPLYAVRADCPDFIVADIAAKRAIIAMATDKAEFPDWLGGYEDAVVDVLRLLAAPWSSHPDYSEEWARSSTGLTADPQAVNLELIEALRKINATSEPSMENHYDGIEQANEPSPAATLGDEKQ